MNTMAIRDRSGRWNELAEETRAIAAGLGDARAIQTMLEIAERYERLAQYTEAQAASEAGDAPPHT